MDQPIKKSMNKPETFGRMVQWAIELSQLDIEYHPRTAIKAQALVDFIAEFTLSDEGSLTNEAERWTVQTDEALATVTVARIRSFVWKNIICKFRIPRTIISDNGRQFDSQGFRDFCSGLGIKEPVLIPRASTGEWIDRAKTPTGETPFRLTYGTEAVIRVEGGVTSIRRKVFNEEENDDHLRINLDCLDEVRDRTSCQMTEYQQKMVEYYNKRVKLKRLDIGDLVLRKVTTATRDSA
ncbi:uncharacterized protein LOC136067354 [Quercus suber]|uniref:uncharacterized protein LOC136067354 n=1 Tax=Quercus suber TaxID=58331 RepID=UPI0032DF206A